MTRLLFPAVISLAIPLAAAQPDRLLMTFSIVDENPYFESRLPNGLRLTVEKDGLGWVVGVFRGKSTDSLLYPQRRWHGAWPCHLYAWSHKQKTFPDIRVIPIRGYRQSLVVDMTSVNSSGEAEQEKFTGGTITISLRLGA